jgi:hypothetical protein
MLDHRGSLPGRVRSVQTGSGVHPASYLMGCGVKHRGSEADHSPASSARVENGGALPSLPLWLHGIVLDIFTSAIQMFPAHRVVWEWELTISRSLCNLKLLSPGATAIAQLKGGKREGANCDSQHNYPPEVCNHGQGQLRAEYFEDCKLFSKTLTLTHKRILTHGLINGTCQLLNLLTSRHRKKGLCSSHSNV